MYLIERKAVKKVLSIVCMVALLVSIAATNIVGAAALELQTPMTLSRVTDKSAIVLNQQFTVNYKIEPQPVTAAQVTPPPKEFFLVIDTSGSMKWRVNSNENPNWGEKSRLQTAKDAANKFLEGLKGKTGVKAGLIAYDNNATIKCSLTSNMDTVKAAVNDLWAEGGTNIGDGLRIAYYELMKTGTTAEKYIVLLTDGEPTYHTCTGSSPTSYKMNDGISTNHKGGGSSATEEDKQYCYKVADELVKKNGIKSFMIAFTKGSNQNILSTVAQKAGGTYKQAMDETALDQVYTGISQEIINDFSVQNVTFEETIPNGLSVVSASNGLTAAGQKVSGSLPSIQYHLNKTTNQYTASPIEFSVTYKGNLVGSYTLGSENSSKLTYVDTKAATQTLYFGQLNIEVKNVNAQIDLSRNLDIGQIKVGQQATINFRINPQPVQLGSALDTSEKEIVLVFDTSTSMEKKLDGNDAAPGEKTREQIAKSEAVTFVNSLAGKPGIKVALVSFSNKAEIRSGLTSDLEAIKTQINNLPTISGTNIGDGLRRANEILDNGSAATKKFIVLLTDGEPYHYSKANSANNAGYYYGSGTAQYVASDANKAKEYSEKVVDTIIKGKNYSNYYIAFSEKINMLESLAAKANGKYETALNAEALGNIYTGISEVIKSDMVVENVQFSEVLPAGISLVEASDGITASGQTISGSLSNIAYKYDEATGKHTAVAKEFTVKIQADTMGNFILGEGNSSVLSYTDINGESAAKYFPELPLNVVEDPDPPYEALDPDDPDIVIGTPGFTPLESRRVGEEAIVKVEITVSSDTESWSLVNPDGVAYLINETTMEISGLSIYSTYDAKLTYTLNDGTTGETTLKRLYTKIDIN